jgi:endonuclease YncB( thermonuclease family)
MPLLLKQGLCWAYEKYGGEAPPEIQTSYRAAQSAARSDKLGLWPDPLPVPPVEMAQKRKGTRRDGARGVLTRLSPS